jgi:hypothetical protein
MGSSHAWEANWGLPMEGSPFNASDDMLARVDEHTNEPGERRRTMRRLDYMHQIYSFPMISLVFVDTIEQHVLLCKAARFLRSPNKCTARTPEAMLYRHDKRVEQSQRKDTAGIEVQINVFLFERRVLR